jgi:hypothetical protein
MTLTQEVHRRRSGHGSIPYCEGKIKFPLSLSPVHAEVYPQDLWRVYPPAAA